jgi:moderate conductance mechanosensitive channel
MLVRMLVDPTPTPGATSACTPDDEICNQIYHWTGPGWLADGGYYLLVQPARIVVILLVAFVVRALLKQSINRIVNRAAEGKVPTLLRPFRDKMPAVAVTSPMFPERRRQRAAAIGSVLKSLISVVVFTIAFLMILDLIGFSLAPVLTSLGIVGLAIGFGAQTLVKDLIAGMFMLLEDQYGVGDVIDTGEAVGVVESVGLRTVTIRDATGVVWYVRNGEIIRVGNRSQGWAQVMIDVPIGFASVDEATTVLREAVDALAADPIHTGEFLETPQVLGVEQITVDGSVIRVTCRTTSERQWDVQRELRRRITEALGAHGITAQVQAVRQLRSPASRDAPTQP